VNLKRFGVLGWPVAHSRSPQIHHAAYDALNLDGWRYQKLPVPPDLFAETVRALAGAGFDGANVTIPHKEAALALADTATDEARAIGAANTLTFPEDGTIAADNTDAPGFLAALGGSPPQTALVLGAGGSARAVVWALAQAGTEVCVLARTRRDLPAGTFVDAPVPAEMLVNCTPLGLAPDDALPLDPEGYARVVDLVYAPGGTQLVNRARQAGSETVDGLEVLVRQGALSFERWTGLDAPLDAMRLAAQATS
jgi:shikimate dehydrogenase